MKAIDPVRTNPQQRKYLQKRLSDLRWDREATAAIRSRKKPAAVIKAEKTLKAWQRQTDNLESAVSGARTKIFKIAEQAVLFGTPAEALVAVQLFESQVKRP